MERPQEIELKFESQANTQLKFISIDTSEVILKKLHTLCNILNISLRDPKPAEISDEYFDDENATLYCNGCTFRHRTKEGRHRVTLKARRGFSSETGLQRLEEEFECNAQEIRNLLKTPTDVAQLFRDKLGVGIVLGSLRKVLTVTNRRTAVPLLTQLAEYTFCYDMYYYYHDSDGYSEYFTEIEIELKGQQTARDQQLEKLREAITTLLNYSPNQKAKLERGLDWRFKKNADIETVYVMAFDIISYSLRQADVQKQMIQVLNHFAKTAIREIRGEGAEQSVIYLPTGDGMILVFQDRPETLVSITFAVQKKVRAYNKTRTSSDRFEFRTGLHAGQVFKYSDVNENLNFAGNGINLAQRVMSLGDAWHILATREGYEAMGNTDMYIHPYFKSLGTYQVKHGVGIEVYNVHSREEQCGNPTDPVD